MNATQIQPAPRRQPSTFWPIMLIGLGVLVLLSQFGWFPVDRWLLLARLWPLLLIAAGLELVFGRSGRWSALISAAIGTLTVVTTILLLVFAPAIPAAIVDFPNPSGATVQTQHIAHPLGTAQQADVAISFAGQPGTITALTGSTNLVEGDVTYYGDLVDSYSVEGNQAHYKLATQFTGWNWGFWNTGSQQWTLGLNPSVVYDLSLNTGSGSVNYDLHSLQLRSLALNVGSGSSDLNLPASGQYRFTLNAGSGSVRMNVPQGVAVRVEYSGGSGSFNAPGMSLVSGTERRGTYETPGFTQAGSYVIIDLRGGSGSVSIR